MRIRAKITLLLGILVVVSLAFIFVQYMNERNRSALLLENIVVQQETFFVSIVQLAGQGIAIFASDYTFWDDMVSFVEDPSPQFAEEILEEGLGTFEADRLFIYDPELELVYGVALDQEMATPPELPVAAWEQFRQARQDHFFFTNGTELVEYRIATIHPTNDPERRTEPLGFFLVGKVWNEAYIANLESLTGMTIMRADEAVSEDIVFSYEMPGWNNASVTSFIITQSVPAVAQAVAASKQQLALIASSLVFLLLLTYIFLELFVGRPLGVLVRSIDRKDMRAIKALEPSRSEFGMLARVVLRFSEHELVLEAKAKNDAILAAVGSGLAAVDIHENITLINAAAERLLGASAGDALGKPFASVFQMRSSEGEMIRNEDLPIVRALRSRRVHTGRLLCIRADGVQFPTVVTAAPVVLEGAVIGAVQDFRDVTEDEAVERAKRDFVSLISHELRTPLTSLRWSVEKLGTIIPKDTLATIDAAITRMRTLIASILDVSRIETGSLSIANAPMDLASMLKRLIEEHAPLIEQKKLSVELELPVLKRPVYSDERLLQALVNNVLTNAVKYASESSTVTVTVTEEENSLSFVISNSGPGIPIDEQSSIFTKLFRASNARSLHPDGTGLGLYVSKSFLERLGGSISFISVPGKETAFTIRLPYGSAT